MLRLFSLMLLRLKKLWLIMWQPKLILALARFGVMAGVEHRAVLNRPLKTVIDIGANRGQFALVARALSGAKVISFEPLPRASKVFRNVFSRDSSVKLHEAAIGNVSGRKLMHLSAHDDSSSLLEIGEIQCLIFPGTQEIDTLDVKVGALGEFCTIDEIVRPAMLKLDVQGYELQALEGCKGLISSFDYVYSECSFVELYTGQKLAWEIIEWLSAKDFCLMGVFNLTYDSRGQAVQADFLFGRKDNLSPVKSSLL